MPTNACSTQWGWYDSCHQHSCHSITSDPFYYHPPSFSCHLLCHLTIISWSISLFLPVPSNSCVYWYAIWQFDRFSAFLLEADSSQRYPNINEAQRSLSNTPQTSWLVVSIIPPVQCKNTLPRQLSDHYSAPEAAHDRRAATKHFRWVRQRDTLRRGAAAALNVGRLEMNEGGGRFTMVPCFSPLFFDPR